MLIENINPKMKAKILQVCFALLFCCMINAAVNAAPTDTKANTEQSKNIESSGDYYTKAVIFQVLNKITAKTSYFTAKMNQETSFGTIKIKPVKCWKSPPEEMPENKLLIEIQENKNNQPEKVIFFGWMFSSSISLSNFEHPVYDVIVIECKD